VLDETTEDLADELIDQLEKFLADKCNAENIELGSVALTQISKAERFVCLLKEPALASKFLEGLEHKRLAVFAKEKFDKYAISVESKNGRDDFSLYLDFTFGLYESEQ
jgi:hypothetical protein